MRLSHLPRLASLIRLRVALKFADYAAEAFATDTTKYWLEVEYTWQ